jgi:hypothetical protein
MSVKILHQVWVQGEENLPLPFKQNREKWRSELTDEWEMILWDDESASEKWPEFKAVTKICNCHAMRADIILALALRDIGGVATGTDVAPNNIPDFLRFISATDTMVIINPSGKACSNGLVWMANPKNPLMDCLCRHQLRDRKLLEKGNVWQITGPKAWWEAVNARMWDLTMVTDRKAYTKLYSEKKVGNPKAWVDAGYAGSWHKK